MARRIALRALVVGLFGALIFGAVTVGAPVLVQPVYAAADDTATVCRETADTVNTGMKDFVLDMQQVSSKAQGGDLAGADATVQHAGATLGAIATKLHEQSDADDPALKQAVTDLATEFAALGGRLTGVASLQAFDTTRLSQLAEDMARLCGASPSPHPSGEPGGSPSPGPAPRFGQ